MALKKQTSFKKNNKKKDKETVEIVSLIFLFQLVSRVMNLIKKQNFVKNCPDLEFWIKIDLPNKKSWIF